MASRRKTGRPNKPRVHLAVDVSDSSAVDLDKSGIPTAFRLFKFGVNQSEKGTFLFDAISAESVMNEYRLHGKPMLVDYNHGTTLWDPTHDQGISAGEFIPEVRGDGSLWATAIKWTERASEYLSAKEYRLFSPYFEHDALTGRVLRLINVALTNLPALDGIEPLVAANATDTEGADAMEWEKLYNELKVRFDAIDTENKALRAKLTAFEEKEPDKASAVQLRATVLSLVGKGSSDEALGTIQALKASHETLTALNAKLAADKATSLDREFSTLLDQASEKGKVPKAARAMWETWAKEDGVEKTLVRLRAFVETAPELVRTAANAVTPPAAGGKPVISDIRRAIAKQDGTPIEVIEKWEAEQAKQAG
jgi:phage I-like protein